MATDLRLPLDLSGELDETRPRLDGRGGGVFRFLKSVQSRPGGLGEGTAA